MIEDRHDNGKLPGEHVGGQVSLLLDKLSSELGAFAELVADDLLHFDQLPLLQIVQYLWIWVCTGLLYFLQLFSADVCYRVCLEIPQLLANVWI